LQVSEDYLTCLLRMMRAIRDHREAGTPGKGDVGPITEKDLDTSLRLTFDHRHLFAFPTWLTRKGGYRFRDKHRGEPWLESSDYALVYRVCERLGLPHLEEPLAKKLLTALARVSLPPKLSAADASALTPDPIRIPWQFLTIGEGLYEAAAFIERLRRDKSGELSCGVPPSRQAARCDHWSGRRQRRRRRRRRRTRMS
jgi:hypothetical protein